MIRAGQFDKSTDLRIAGNAEFIFIIIIFFSILATARDPIETRAALFGNTEPNIMTR